MFRSANNSEADYGMSPAVHVRRWFIITPSKPTWMGLTPD